MCGIFGIYALSASTYDFYEKSIAKLMTSSSSRGKEASGLLAYNEQNEAILHKSGVSGNELLRSKSYRLFVEKCHLSKVKSVLGHSRLATHGSQIDNDNNQPLLSTNFVSAIVHNGIVTNTSELWKKMDKKTSPPVLDSQILFEYITYCIKQSGYLSSFKQLNRDIEGSVSIAYFNINDQVFFLYSNTGSLYYFLDEKNQLMYYASERIFLQDIAKDFRVKTSEIVKINPGDYVIFLNSQLIRGNTNDILEDQMFITPENGPIIRLVNIEEEKKDVSKTSYINTIQQLKKHTIDFNRIKEQVRCSKCILPASTPFIHFDNSGVCNFCREHSPITYKGKPELESILENYRSKDGSPDCIAAFSGGRDSSYGLHYLKKELGMHPMAYTYDWGMVTDLARRNQARMLGSLGVEHLLLSADINKKREHIRKNILAWMKDPDLGMVPLFMQGDKQCEFHANQLMKKYNLKLMFFFRGNEFEKEEFKNGHCGIKDADPGGVIHHLPLKDKLKLLSYYGIRYLKNPAYFNASFWDTGLAYFSTYIQPHDYLYLWHYIPWDEELINKTLIQEYNWEKSSETTQMWRTDDGSSAFYNYIYCQVQGFTENDSFRSRQIREGKLTRKQALELVLEENQPRYESLKWYFDLLDLNGSDVLKVVDKMPKLY